MIITLICDVFGQENNGTTITARRLIDGLKARGHEVRMLSTFKSSDPMFYTVPTRSFGPFNNYVAKNGVKLAKKDEAVIRKAIYGADIVHIMLPFKLAKVSVPIIREYGIPFTTAFHCQPENVTVHFKLNKLELANKIVYDYFRHKLYRHTEFIHCPSEFIANECDRHGYKANKVVISNGIIPTFRKMDVKKPDVFKDKFCILFIGRYSHEKRHDLLIKAVKMSKYEKDIQLIFAGQGPWEKGLRKMGEKLTNKPVLKFMTKEQLNGTINFCDLYCHPSDVEIEAISCLEAITCGLVPVISNSKKSATKFFALDQNNLFKAGDAKDLKDKIEYWIEHPAEKEELSKRYVEYAKQFEIEHCIDEMVEMFNMAIDSFKKKSTQIDKKSA